MDSHDAGRRLLAAFLAGELSHADAPRWDEHLLECEQCWRAVREDRAGGQAAQLLREPAPPGLADRIRFAVELAAAGTIAPQRQPGHGLRWRWHWLAAAGALAAAVAVTVALLVPGGPETGNMPAAVAAVARYATTIPAGWHQQPGAQAGTPVEVGHPVPVAAGGQQMVLRVWRLGRAEAVVAVSGQPFPMPTRARGITGPGMTWTTRLGNISLYCRNGHTSELVAAPLPPAQLAALAARLPPA